MAGTRVFEMQNPSRVRDFPFSGAVFTPDGKTLLAPINIIHQLSEYRDDKCGIATYDALTGRKASEWTRRVCSEEGICLPQPYLLSTVLPDDIITYSFQSSEIAAWNKKTGALSYRLAADVGLGGPAPSPLALTLIIG